MQGKILIGNLHLEIVRFLTKFDQKHKYIKVQLSATFILCNLAKIPVAVPIGEL